MKIEKCIKESFVVIGKEGSTLDGENLFSSSGMISVIISRRLNIWPKKMKMAICWVSGE